MKSGNNTGYLLLEDGSRYEGVLLEAGIPGIGEAVFNTSMTGYQEVLYDPSYYGQIVVMTAAQIGNTGITPGDNESGKPWVKGFVVRQFTAPSNWRSQQSLQNFLRISHIPALSDVDTRAITRHVRNHGSMRAGIFPVSIGMTEALEAVQAHPPMQGTNAAAQVSCPAAYDWEEGSEEKWLGNNPVREGRKYRVAVLDFGVKLNILRRLIDVGCSVKVFPLSADIDEIESFHSHGILLSNGPGDPAAVTGAVGKIQHFLGRLPIFGICLGHQLLAIAAGGSTYKMKFGHRGINHPVGLNPTGQVTVSVHNHGFAVDRNSLPVNAKVTLISLNDGTIEGIEYPGLSAFSVQFHPEASPGPHDAGDLFIKFRQLMDKNAAKN